MHKKETFFKKVTSSRDLFKHITIKIELGFMLLKFCNSIIIVLHFVPVLLLQGLSPLSKTLVAALPLP